MLIGICGKSGSGKSTLSKLFLEKNKNMVYLDIDKIGHLSHEDEHVKEKLVNTFGESIINDNVINRKVLSNLVFSSMDNMQKLIDITWPFMEEKIKDFISDNKEKDIILDWQLLPRVSFFKMCTVKILLDIPFDIRRKRIIERDRISNDDFILRDKAGITYNKMVFDIVVDDDSYEKLKEVVEEYDKGFISR